MSSVINFKRFLDLRACLKNHSCHLHVPLCVIFAPNSGYIARYAPFIWHKSPTNCDAHLAESIFQTRPSEQMRKGYQSSLEDVDRRYREKLLEHFGVLPPLFEEIYGICNGTKADLTDQIYFDFLPGYRLMQIDEIIAFREKDDIDRSGFEQLIPFLTDYGGWYYAYASAEGRECIVLVADNGVELMHSDIDSFWKTITAFYNEGVYYCDEDGFLAYDFEKESVIGKQYNIGIGYWEDC